MIVLDTHALVWWVSEDERLSAPAIQAIRSTQAEGGRLLVSAITAWEIAMLIRDQRMALTMELDEWLRAVHALPGVEWVSVSPLLAAQSVTLPGDFHKDPADRMIVALARQRNIPLITGDQKIRDYAHVHAIW